MLQIKETVLGPGRPKIAVPVTGRTPEEIIGECEEVRKLPCDIIEWRVDHYLSAFDDLDERLEDKGFYLEIIKILDDINLIAGEMPVIFTIRSEEQGGEVSLTEDQMDALTGFVARTGFADIIDMELPDDIVHERILRTMERAENIHSHGGKVMFSYHTFDRMPDPEEIISYVELMKKMGGDIFKIAGMSSCREDTENLIKTSAYLMKKGTGPLVMIAMGRWGMPSRVAAGRYGSCITFASGRQGTAPGQQSVESLKKKLDEYYGEE